MILGQLSAPFFFKSIVYNNKKMKKSFFIFLCGLAVVSFAPVVTAQTGCPTGLVPCGGENCPCTTCHIFEMFKNVMDFILFFIVPPLAALMIAIGGFMLVFAYLGVGDGGPGMISQAKKLFASVAIGLVIVYGAYAIIGLFLQSIGLADWTEKIYQSWWKESFFKIECETTAPAGGGSTSGGSTGGATGGTSGGTSGGSATGGGTGGGGTNSGTATILSDRLFDNGDEVAVKVQIQNTSGERKHYWVELKTGDGKKITGAEQKREKWLNPGETAQVEVSTYGPGASISDLGTHYRIEVWDTTDEGNNVKLFERTKEVPK